MKTLRWWSAWLICYVALGMTGCADMTTFYKSISTTAVAAAGCRDVLSVAHETKTAMVKRSTVVDYRIAEAELDAWMVKYEKIKTACTVAKVGAQSALAAAPVIEAAATKKKDATAWVVRLVAMGMDIATALADAGLKLPGGTP